MARGLSRYIDHTLKSSIYEVKICEVSKDIGYIIYSRSYSSRTSFFGMVSKSFGQWKPQRTDEENEVRIFDDINSALLFAINEYSVIIDHITPSELKKVK